MSIGMLKLSPAAAADQFQIAGTTAIVSKSSRFRILPDDFV
jgi:hypothetical protein